MLKLSKEDGVKEMLVVILFYEKRLENSSDSGVQ